MRSTLALLRLAIQHSLAYRSEIFVWMILDTIPTVVLFVVWSIIFRDGQVHQGYTFAQMIEYSLYLLVINAVTAVHFESARVRQIREGKIDMYLIRPISYIRQVFMEHLGGRLFFLTIFFPLFFVLQFVMTRLYDVHFSPLSPSIVLSMVVLLFFGSLIEFAFGMTTVLLGFWFEYSEGLEHFKWLVITLLSGAMVPTAFLPSWLQRIVMALPFRYMYAEVINVVQARNSLHFTDFLTMIITTILCVAGIQLLWQRARYQYASGGG